MEFRDLQIITFCFFFFKFTCYTASQLLSNWVFNKLKMVLHILNTHPFCQKGKKVAFLFCFFFVF